MSRRALFPFDQNVEDMYSEENLVTQFHAIIPDLASAINISGNGYSRIKLDVAEDELGKVMELMREGRERVLLVTIHRA